MTKSLLNADVKFHPHLPAHLQHLTQIIQVFENKTNLVSFTFSLNELIETYLEKESFDQDLAYNALLLYWLIQNAQMLDVAVIDATPEQVKNFIENT